MGRLVLPVEIMVDQRGVVIVYRNRRIVERRQEIGSDVPNVRCVLCHRVNHILNVAVIQFEIPGFVSAQEQTTSKIMSTIS